MADGGIELKRIVEAALFVADTPLTVQKLLSLFPDDGRPSTDELRQAVDALAAEYADRAIELKRVGGGYRFQSRHQYSPWLRKLWEQRPPRYSRALMETLAIVAYRQPVTRGDIEDIRGVTVSTDIMRALLDRGWIRQVGTRDVPGRPALFGTTRAFLEYFNLERLSDLPPLAEMRAREAVAEDHNLSLPLEDEGAAGERGEAAAEPGDRGDDRAGEGGRGEEDIEHLPLRTEFPAGEAGDEATGESGSAGDTIGASSKPAEVGAPLELDEADGVSEEDSVAVGESTCDADDADDAVRHRHPAGGNADGDACGGEGDSEDAGHDPDTHQAYPQAAEAKHRGR